MSAFGSFHVACKLTKLAVCRCDLGGVDGARDAVANDEDDPGWGGRRVWLPDPQFMETIQRHAMYGPAAGLAPSAQDKSSQAGLSVVTEQNEELLAKAMMSAEEVRYGYVKEFGVQGGPEELDQDDGGDAADGNAAGDGRQSGSDDDDDADPPENEDLSEEEK